MYNRGNDDDLLETTLANLASFSQQEARNKRLGQRRLTSEERVGRTWEESLGRNVWRESPSLGVTKGDARVILIRPASTHARRKHVQRQTETLVFEAIGGESLGNRAFCSAIPYYLGRRPEVNEPY